MIFKGFMNIHEDNFPISEIGFVIYFAQGISSLQNTLFPPLWFLVHIVVYHKLAAYSRVSDWRRASAIRR
jgi:hypothetical protein